MAATHLVLIVDNSGGGAPEQFKFRRVDQNASFRGGLKNRKAPAMRNTPPNNPFRPVGFRRAQVGGNLVDDFDFIHAGDVRTDCPSRQDRLCQDISSLCRHTLCMAKRISLQQAKERLGRRLAILREGMDLSQDEFAENLGISQTRYSKYESGRSQPPLDILIAISQITNQSLDFLVAGLTAYTPPAPATDDDDQAQHAG